MTLKYGTADIYVNSFDNSVLVDFCTLCGALVWDKNIHNDFHGEPVDPESVL